MAEPKKGKGNFALVKFTGAFDSVLLSLHNSKEDAERAMDRLMKKGHYSSCNSFFIQEIGPQGSWEVVEVFDKLTTRPKS
jgi:hypothetical protein